MQCPECFTTGLEANERIATQYGSKRDKFIYATRCPNDECDCTRVPPREIRHQLETGFSRVTLGKLFREFSFRTAATFTALVLLVGAIVLATGGLSIPLPFNTTDTVAASGSPYGNLTTTDAGSLLVSNETGNWTIYEYGGHYVVSAEQNGTIVYLNPTGNVTPTPYVYETRSAAHDAILAWGAKHDQHPSHFPAPNTSNSTSLGQHTNWTMFESNGSYVVAGRINGSLVYLYPNGTYSEFPYVYPDFPDAERAISNWELHDDRFPSRLPSIEPVTYEEVHHDLVTWDPNGTKWSPADPDPADYDWNWDWWRDTDTPSDDSGQANTSDDIDATNTSETKTAYRVRGTVTDNNDEPIGDATVHLHSTHQTTKTDSNGSYRFENVTPGNHVVYVDPSNNSSLAATDPVEFTMTDAGDIQVHGEPANAVYFTSSDGTVAENTIQLLTRQHQPIQVHGTGSSMTSKIRFDQPLNAEQTTVTLIGVDTATRNTTTFTGYETNGTVTMGGNTNVQRQQLSLRGTPVSKPITRTGTYRGTNPEVPILGNLRPRNVQVTLSANRSKNRVTDTGQVTLNPSPTNIALLETAKADLSSDGDSQTNGVGRSGTYEIAARWHIFNDYYDYTMDGFVRLQRCSDTNCETIRTVERNQIGEYEESVSTSGTITATVELEKDETIRVQTECHCTADSHVQVDSQVLATYQDDVTQTKTISVDGNVPPESASLTLTGTKALESRYDIPRVRVDGDARTGDTVTDKSVLFYAPADGYYEVAIPWRVKAYTVNAWGTELGGSTELELHVAGREVLSKSAYTMAGEEETHSGTYTTTVYLEKGDIIESTVEARNAGKATIFGADGGVVTRADTGRVTVSVNNEAKQTTALSADESRTLTVPLDTGQNRISVSTSDGKAVEYALEYVEQNGTKSPTVRVGNRTVCSLAGVFDGRQTCDVPQSKLDPTQNETVDITTDSGPVNYTVEYQARAIPEDATVTFDGTTYRYPNDFNSTGRLMARTEGAATRNISALTLGETDVHVRADSVDGLHPSVVATLEYTGEHRQTERPVVVVESPNGSTHQRPVPDTALASNGTLHGNYTMTLPATWFGDGDNVVRVRTTGRSQVRAVVTSSGLIYQNQTFNETTTVSRFLPNDRLHRSRNVA